VTRRLRLLIATLAVATVGCGSEGLIAESPVVESPDADTQITDGQDVDSQDPASRDDVDCSAEGLGADDEFEFVTAHYVVDGELGALCFGEESDTLNSAWNELATITPRGQLSDLGLFAGFAADESGDEVTAAFVNAIDDDGIDFQMSINIDDFESDPDEASLTIAHEFAHVFTSVESEVDRTVFEAEDCATYFNSDGCFYPESIMAQWVALFWGDGLIDEIDPYDEPTAADGEDRCDANPSFFGPYAASNPEEDFAEAFSAFVYRVEPTTQAQQAKLDWIGAQPGLDEFRQRAIDAGRGPLPNNFEMCG